MNRRLSLETNPNPIIEDTTIHLINSAQEKRKHSLEGPSISTIVVEQVPHGSIQEANRRCSLGDVSNPTSTQSDKLPSQDEAHEEALDMEPTVEEALDIEPTVEEENIIRTIDEDVGLPPSNYQEENEGQQVATEMPEHIVDALDDRNTTLLPPLESTRRRTPKCIQVDEGLLNSIEGTLSKRSVLSNSIDTK